MYIINLRSKSMFNISEKALPLVFYFQGRPIKRTVCLECLLTGWCINWGFLKSDATVVQR